MSAHDVRNLGQCILCHDIGSFDPRASVALLLVLRNGSGKTGRGVGRIGAHPRCLVRGAEKKEDISFITKLGVEEMGKIRRDDLPDHLYRRVIVAHDSQSRRLEGKGP